MFKKTSLFALLAAATLIATSCSDNASGSSDMTCTTEAGTEATSTTTNTATTTSTTETTANTTVATTQPQPPAPWNPAVIQRQVMFDEGYMCGVVYLGYVDAEATVEECRQIFYNSTYSSEFEFITDIPDENCIDTGTAYELYLIIPQDVAASVAVNTWTFTEENDFMGEADEVLYRSDTGAPFLLKCNYSDIMPNTVVNIVDSNGREMQWHPSLSLKDGSVSRYGNEENVYDLTHYIYNETFEYYRLEDSTSY